MAAEIQYRHSATGSTMRATVRKEQTVGGKAQLWNGSAWEDMTVANWATYLVTLTETPASSYVYIGDMPAVAAGWYYVDIYSGTAISSTLEATLFGYWDGTVISLGGADPTTASKTGYALVSTGLDAVVLPANILTAAAVKDDAVTKIQAGLSTLTQTQVSGGAYDLTNATFVAAFKAAIGTVPASGNWNTVVPDAAGTMATFIGVAGANLTALVTATGFATADELAKVPKSDGSVTWNATARTSITTAATAATPTVKLGNHADHGGAAAAITLGAGVSVGTAVVLPQILAGGLINVAGTVTLANLTLTNAPTIAGSTGYPLRTDDTGDNAVARKGSGTVTLTTVTTAIGTRQETVANLATAVATVEKLDTTLVQDGVVWDFTPAAIDPALAAFTGDTGITLPKALEMLAAFMAGEVTASSAGGVTTYTYLKRDGSTTSFTAKCTEADGTRATTGSLS